MQMNWRWFRNHPRPSLIVLYMGWKLLLLSVALASPGLGYDTSTTLLHLEPGFSGMDYNSGLGYLSPNLDSLIRWDAVYFTQIGRRGYLWEQEWAFGWGFTKSLAAIGRGIVCCASSPDIVTEFCSHCFFKACRDFYSRSVGGSHSIPCFSPSLCSDAV